MVSKWVKFFLEAKEAKVAINLTKALTAAAVGVGDELAERNNRAVLGNVELLDAYRLGAVLLGHAAGIFMPRYGALGETVATAATPLAVKSIARMAKLGTTGRSFTPRSVAGPSVRNWAPSMGGGGAYRPMRVTT